MNIDENISEEFLNAYVDNELDAEDRQRAEQAMRRDERLRRHVEELRELKQLVKSAYIDELPERGPSRSSRLMHALPVTGLAASVAAFALGVALTWGWFSYVDGGAPPRVASVTGREGAPATNPDQAIRVVFHLSRNDPGYLQAILTEAGALLDTASRGGTTAAVRIIASGAGLSLFEDVSTPETRRLKTLKQKFSDKLVVNGCGVAYKQLNERHPDEELELLPEVQLVDLGVLELMRRQRDGWAYIRL